MELEISQSHGRPSPQARGHLTWLLPNPLCDYGQVTSLLGLHSIPLDNGMRSPALPVSPGRGRGYEHQMRSWLGKCEQEKVGFAGSRAWGQCVEGERDSEGRKRKD